MSEEWVKREWAPYCADTIALTRTIRRPVSRMGSLWVQVGGSGIPGERTLKAYRVDRKCPTLPRREAAELWAVSVYARRILDSWTPGEPGSRASLQWLRDRVAAEAAS